jgi:hypothetical protein
MIAISLEERVLHLGSFLKYSVALPKFFAEQGKPY